MFPSKDPRRERCRKVTRSTPESNLPCDYLMSENRLLTEEQNMATISEDTDSGKFSRFAANCSHVSPAPKSFLGTWIGL